MDKFDSEYLQNLEQARIDLIYSINEYINASSNSVHADYKKTITEMLHVIFNGMHKKVEKINRCDYEFIAECLADAISEKFRKKIAKHCSNYLD